MVKMTVFVTSKWPKLISRKIWVAEKPWNFHIVYSQLGCPGLYSGEGRYIIARKEVCFCQEVLKRVRGNWIYSFYLFIQAANCRLIQWILKFFILSLLLRFISCLNVLLFNFFLFKGHWIIFWREPNICLSK